jgi:hypothetical protein
MKWLGDKSSALMEVGSQISQGVNLRNIKILPTPIDWSTHR